jgi:ABC-type Fe3+-siderophore transport system permease subunit
MNLKIILIASFGAAMLELIFWHELRNRLDNRRYRKLLRSTSYWLIVGAFIIGSGVATWIWYGAEQSGQMSREPREYFLVGAAFPLLLKRAVSAIDSSGKPTLGDSKREIGTNQRPVWRDYFQLK